MILFLLAACALSGSPSARADGTDVPAGVAEIECVATSDQGDFSADIGGTLPPAGVTVWTTADGHTWSQADRYTFADGVLSIVAISTADRCLVYVAD